MALPPGWATKIQVVRGEGEQRLILPERALQWPGVVVSLDLGVIWGTLDRRTPRAQTKKRFSEPPGLITHKRPRQPQAAHCLCACLIYRLPPLPELLPSGPLWPPQPCPVSTGLCPWIRGDERAQLLRKSACRQPLKVGVVQGLSGRKQLCSERPSEESEGSGAP